MSDTSTADPGKPMKQLDSKLSDAKEQLPVTTEDSEEQLNENLSKAMEQLSVTTSDEHSTSPKNLSDMPIDVAELIIQKADYREQLALRKVSKTLHALVDNQKPACKRLKVFARHGFTFEYGCIICKYNDHCVEYVSPMWNRRELYSDREQYHLDTIIKKDDYERIAFEDLTFTLKNPKLQLEEFSFYSDGFGELDDFDSVADYYNTRFGYKFENFQNLLKSINHQLHVKAYGTTLFYLSNGVSMLPYLKPGVLEKITIFYDGYGLAWYEYGMEQIALLDQWKQAKELEAAYRFDEIPKEHLSHFKRFQFREGYLQPDKLIGIRDYILENENVEFCSLKVVDVDVKDFESVVGTPVSPNLSHYSTPDSEYYLEFKFLEKSIEIRKIKKS